MATKLSVSRSRTSLDPRVQDLVAELSKEKPNQSIVKRLMSSLKLPFSENPLEQMSVCLQFLSGTVKFVTHPESGADL